MPTCTCACGVNSTHSASNRPLVRRTLPLWIRKKPFKGNEVTGTAAICSTDINGLQACPLAGLPADDTRHGGRPVADGVCAEVSSCQTRRGVDNFWFLVTSISGVLVTKPLEAKRRIHALVSKENAHHKSEVASDLRTRETKTEHFQRGCLVILRETARFHLPSAA